MLLNAYCIFKDERFLNSAIRAGNLIWEKGLLLKGNGLCHGITGNAYALLCIFRETKDHIWLSRGI